MKWFIYMILLGAYIYGFAWLLLQDSIYAPYECVLGALALIVVLTMMLRKDNERLSREHDLRHGRAYELD